MKRTRLSWECTLEGSERIHNKHFCSLPSRKGTFLSIVIIGRREECTCDRQPFRRFSRNSAEGAQSLPRSEGRGRRGEAGKGTRLLHARAEESPRIAPARRQRPRREPCFNLLEASFLGSRTCGSPHGESNHSAKTRGLLVDFDETLSVLHTSSRPAKRSGPPRRGFTSDYQRLPITDASSAVNPELRTMNRANPSSGASCGLVVRHPRARLGGGRASGGRRLDGASCNRERCSGSTTFVYSDCE
jgi:hypothetical protein